MIELDADQKTPLYEQLYAALADEIRTGQRAPGTPLPGRRTMAAQQGVSVNTVDAAYQMLAAEGLAEPRPRSGFYVQKTYGMLHSRARHAPAAPAPQPPAAPQPVYDLSTGSVDTALFPARSWGRIQKELLYQRPELLQRGEMQGDAPLRTQIAEYLSVYRGVECTPEQIVVGAGIEYLLGCLAHLFSDGMAAIENPGYFRTRTVLQNSGIPCTLVDIDREGLPADALEKSGANLCYLTPSHHFPTGVTMPATRRAQLLAWAAARPGRYILEDDYDSEFRFDTRPLPSLQGMAGPDGPVVYLTTFSKVWPRASALPAWCCRKACWRAIAGILRPTPTRSAALSSRRFASSWRAGISRGILPGCALPTSAAWRRLRQRCARRCRAWSWTVYTAGCIFC